MQTSEVIDGWLRAGDVAFHHVIKPFLCYSMELNKDSFLTRRYVFDRLVGGVAKKGTGIVAVG